MNFLIISHAEHKVFNNKLYAYAPYVREMNLWVKYVDSVTVVAPIVNEKLSEIDNAYLYENIKFNTIPLIAFTSIKKSIYSIFKLPIIFLTIFKACKKTDHIHLRCPGNIGLLGCLVQVFFPKKVKTAKYAGNWDPKSKQPITYKLQKWILGNTFLTRNMNVLVYGEWGNQSKNIKPFFTASFKEKDKSKIITRNYDDSLHFVFVGSLVEGKRPLLSIKIIETLLKKGINAHLKIYGDGILSKDLKDYIKEQKLISNISLEGNKSIEIIKESLKQSHFLLLPSKSEGWPKVIAEAMFFGAIPIATSISCVPNMLGYGSRGILIESNINQATSKIMEALNILDLNKMSKLASGWSQKFTLEYFESEIKKILIH